MNDLLRTLFLKGLGMTGCGEAIQGSYAWAESQEGFITHALKWMATIWERISMIKPWFNTRFILFG